MDDLKITRQQRNRQREIEIINTKRDARRLDIGYMPREVVRCGIPLSKPRRDYLIHTARDGNGVLKVKADPEFGMPFGRDPLSALWLFTEARERKSPIVEFESPRQLLLSIGLPVDGYTYEWAVGSFERNFGATWEYSIEDAYRAGKVKERIWLRLVRRAVLWYNTKPDQMALEGDGFKYRVELTDEAFELAMKGARVEIETCAALSQSPGEMRLFMILRDRCATVPQGDYSFIPLTGTYGLDKQMGVQSYANQKLWRQKVRRWLHDVDEFWPSCPKEIYQGGDGKFRLKIEYVAPPPNPRRRLLTD
jgi:hypothetical protein